MLGREAIRQLHGLVERSHQHDGAVARDRLRAPRRAVGRSRKLPLDFLRHRVGQPLAKWSAGWPTRPHRARPAPACRRRGGAGRHPPAMIRISVGPGDEVDADFARQQLLGRRDIDIARPDDAVGAWAPCACRRRTPRWPARRPFRKHCVDAQQRRRAPDLRHRAAARPRRCSARPPPAPEPPSSAAWRAADSGPRECRRPRYRAAARSARARSPGPHFAQPFRGQLHLRRNARMLAAAVSTARAELRREMPSRGRRSSASATRTALRVEPVELARVFEQRLVAALAHGFENRPHHGFGFGQRAALRRRAGAPICGAVQNADHITILFSGYSTIPCAARLLQPRNDIAHRGFIENGVHRQPFLVAQVRNGGPLQRRQHAPARPSDCPCARSASAPPCPAR